MALRPGFTRYAVRFQYHGGSFLGFSQQKEEDSILSDGTDLRGYTSVETRLRRALHQLVPSFDDEFQLQVSSRTDRGVHALGNTLHVDLPTGLLTPAQLTQGWQYHLMRDEFYHHSPTSTSLDSSSRMKRLKNSSLFPQGNDYIRAGPGQDICILNAVQAPLSVTYEEHDDENWNARFTATERLYVYRILQPPSSGSIYGFVGAPFEWDRSWRLKPRSDGQQLNLHAMQMAADALIGQHDFSSFRAKGCQQLSPTVHVHDIRLQSQPYEWSLGMSGGIDGGQIGLAACESPKLVTISVRAKSFLYRMVRNIVGYLVHVGQQDHDRESMRDTIEQTTRVLLAARNRVVAPSMAPPQGLFLVHVRHGQLEF